MVDDTIPTAQEVDEALAWVRDHDADYHTVLTRIISHLSITHSPPDTNVVINALERFSKAIEAEAILKDVKRKWITNGYTPPEHIIKHHHTVHTEAVAAYDALLAIICPEE